MSRKQNLFTQVPVKKTPRNFFDLGHEVKMSGKFGYLYPVLLMEGLPGDTIRDQMVAQVRFAPMLAPIMHRVDVKTDFFFVPNRILTDSWEEFITGGQDGLSTEVLPMFSPSGINADAGNAVMQEGSLWDYFGLPVYTGGVVAFSGEEISALPFRAYQKIYNDYYRDPNLDQEVDINTELTGNVASTADIICQLRRRGWERDYFTAALPWAQRGAEVLMPLAGEGTPIYSDFSLAMQSADPTQPSSVGPLSVGALGFINDDVPESVQIQNIDSVEITGATTTINDFRRTLAIQAWLENNARGGGRYVEQIHAHFNVRVPDYRLQRAEYLGGGRSPVTISEVLSTADTVDVPVGDMAGHGISVGKSNRFTYRCQEHGFVIGIMTIIPRTSYDQGIERMWTRATKFDYAFPELANLGEQEILNKEIFFSFDSADAADNNEVFGYIPRYSEYKFKNDRIAGSFRSTLAFWHLSRMFNSRPALDSSFVAMLEHDPANEETYRRIFANQDGTDYLWIQLFHNLTAKRPLPYFGVPTLMG